MDRVLRQRSPAPAGHYYIIAPGILHSHGVEEDISTIHVALRPEFLRRIAGEAVPDAGPGLIHFPASVRMASPGLDALLRRLLQEARQVAPWRRLLVDALATELVIQLLRDHGVSVAQEQQAEGADVVTRAIEMILANYDRSLTLNALAAEARMSRYHFLRVFRERVGKPPGAYLRQVRVEKAAELLRCTDLTITEVALRCGFAGPNRLAEAVRQVYGVAPGALRAQAASKK